MATKKSHTYIGPVTSKGLLIKERLYPAPWDWDEKTIIEKMKAEPELKKYFTKDPPKNEG